MKTIEMTGKTVDEALKNALNELKLTKEEVDIEIIDEGSKGIFNLIGNKPASSFERCPLLPNILFLR